MKRGLNRDIFDSMFITPDQLLNVEGPVRSMARGSPSDMLASTEKLSHTGTTILAFQYADGLMFAADRKTSSGYLGIMSLESVKIHQASPTVAIGCAGLVSDTQFIKKSIERVNRAFISQYQHPISIAGQANYLTNLCFRFRHFLDPWGHGLMVQFILGGIDPYLFDKGEDGVEIFEIEGDGCQYHIKKGNYVVIGSGTDGARGFLRENKAKIQSRTLSLNAAMKLAVKAIWRAGEVDNGTSDIRVATPNIAVITKDNGYELFDEARIQRVVESVLKQEEKSHVK